MEFFSSVAEPDKLAEYIEGTGLLTRHDPLFKSMLTSAFLEKAGCANQLLHCPL